MAAGNQNLLVSQPDALATAYGLVGRGQRVLADLGAKPADKHLSRPELITLCEGMPPSWLPSCTAAGTVEQVSSVLDKYLAAGADELILHGVVGERLAPLADYLAAEGG